MIGNRAKFIFLFCVLVFIDQISKFIVMNHFKNGLFFLRGFFGLEFCQNYGMVFGVEIGNMVSISFTIAALGVFWYVFVCSVKFHQCHPEFISGSHVNLSLRGGYFRRGNLIPYLLIFSGAISNLLDRLLRGYVVDFIRFSPIWIFNIADIFILVGLLFLFFQKRELGDCC